MFRFDGRVVLVTGGTRGLGRAIAEGFAAAGADVGLVSRKPESLVVAAAEIAASGGRRVEWFECNVSHWEELAPLVNSVYECFGRLDVLVNNAGLSPLYESPVAITEALFDKVVGVNLKGPLRLCALAGERMAAAGGGVILNVSSTAARHPRPDVIPYAAAKAGVEAMTVAFAHAYGPLVRVNCIVPGPFLTGVSRHWDMEQMERWAKGFALGRLGRPEEIVGAALYLASDAASYTTGITLEVAGGEP
jgi:NAD(P)-dependent dehydrogenase (short-subunit alcohol dehydrogenase family)